MHRSFVIDRRSFPRPGASIALLIAAALAACGCNTIPWDSYAAHQRQRTAPTDAPTDAALEATRVAAKPSPEVDAPPSEPEAAPEATDADDSTARIEAELRDATWISEAERERFLLNLRETEPAQRDALAQQMRSFLAYARRFHEKPLDETAAKEPTPTPAPPLDTASTETPVPTPAAQTPTPAPITPTPAPEQSPEPTDSANASPVRAASAVSTTISAADLLALATPSSAAPLTPGIPSTNPPSLTRKAVENAVQTALYQCDVDAKSAPSGVEFVSDSTSSTMPTTSFRSPNADGATTDDWTHLEHIDEAIRRLEQELRDRPEHPQHTEIEAKIRLLHLAADRRQDALVPIPADAPAVQEFWSKELFGLATLLDPTMVVDATDRATQAKEHFEDAIISLGQQSKLRLRRVCFVEQATGYAGYTPLKSYEFRAGSAVNLYAEVENIAFIQCEKGFLTSTALECRILDQRGHTVAQDERPASEQYYQSPKRDYYTGHVVQLPAHLLPGRYKLMVMLVDRNTQKPATATLDFSIVPSI